MSSIRILALMFAAATGAAAQDYPVRPVRIVVPFPAGGPRQNGFVAAGGLPPEYRGLRGEARRATR